MKMKFELNLDLNKNLLDYLDGAEKLEKAVRRINQ